ncbi:MAG: transglutaminase-like domain-containing protein [Patescibacteria group bacterium]|nr:transglutaminase-like domain-containing protein [Patescibacteria group bacterium]
MFGHRFKDKVMEIAGGRFSRRPQRYQFRYEVRLENTGTKVSEIEIVCPLPSDFDYQTVQDVVFDPSVSGTGREEKYHNAFAWWTLALGSQEVRTVGYTAKIYVTPRRRSFESVPVTPAAAPKSMPAGNRYLQMTDAVIARARQVAHGAPDTMTAARQCYDDVIARLQYGRPIEGLYSATDALTQPAVDCGGFSTLLGSMLISLGIPARVLLGFWAGHPASTMHAWLEGEIVPGSWLPMDPAVEQLRKLGRSKKSGGFGVVGSDRVVVSVGCDYTVKVGNRTVEVPILQHPVIRTSVEGAVRSDVTVRAERI